MVGGKNVQGAASDKGRELALKHRAEIESQVGAGSMFEPVAQRTQVVAGTNYFIKIKLDADKYCHARIWHKLDNSSELHSVEGNKGLNEEL